MTTNDKAGFYRGILPATPAGEIRAIISSPWDTGHYSNGVLNRTAAAQGIKLGRGGRVPFAGWHGSGMSGDVLVSDADRGR